MKEKESMVQLIFEMHFCIMEIARCLLSANVSYSNSVGVELKVNAKFLLE